MESESEITVIKYGDYKALGNSGWFPMKMTLDYGATLPESHGGFEVTIRMENSVTKITPMDSVAEKNLCLEVNKRTVGDNL